MIPAWCALLVAQAQVRPEELDQPARDLRARELYDNGTTLYEEGLYDDAIAAFQEAYRISGMHRLLLHVANCHERAGRWEHAIAVLNRYRAYAAPDERERLKVRIAENRRRIEATPGAERTGVTPLPIPPLRPVLERPEVAARAEPGARATP